MTYIFKHWWIFMFAVSRGDDNWDGGGMDCWCPSCLKIQLRVGNLELEVRWTYTHKQLLRLAKRDPELWHNCSLPKGEGK